MTKAAGRLRTHAPDLKLVQDVLAHAPGAHARLEARIAPTVERCLTRSLARHLHAHREDLLQDFAVYLIDQDRKVLRSYRGEASLTTWIQAVATRYFRAQARRLQTSASKAQPLEGVDELADSDRPTPEQTEVQSQQAHAVRQVVADLDDADRLLLSMTYVDEAPARVIGRLLGLTPAGIRMRKKRLLERLTRRLEEVR